MKDEHRKDYVVGVYQVFDESKRFKDLQDFLKRNSSPSTDMVRKIILDSNWSHADRPDWINLALSAGIEDTTVDDTNHYLDIHFSKRKYEHKAYVKGLSKNKRIKYLKDHGASYKMLKSNKFNEFTFHIPSYETVLKMNDNRSVFTWLKALKNVLDKHRKMLENLDYKEKYIYIYDVTPPYIFKNSASKINMTAFDPCYNKQFVEIYRDYPAKIIWYLKNQGVCTFYDPKEITEEYLKNLGWCDLRSLKPTFPLYDSLSTYTTWLATLRKELGNDKINGLDYFPYSK